MSNIVEGKLQYELIVEAVMQMEYRSTISREEISRIIGEPIGTRKFYSLIGQARKNLVIRGRVLRTVKEQGYMLLHPDECAEVAVSLYKRGGQAISHGQQILNYALADEMSPDALARYKEVCTKARAIHAGLQGAVVELNLLSRPHPLAVR